MDSDPYKKYQAQLEYERYVKNRYNNPIDLATGTEQNESIKLLAEVLFNKSERNLSTDLHGILMDPGTVSVDIFCMAVELFLYGFNILTKNSLEIFQLTDSTDDLIYKLKNYFKSMGFNLKMDEIFDEELNVNLYRDRDDYYCQITSKPPPFLLYSSEWTILDYRILLNRRFSFDDASPLNNFKAFFINKEKRIFILSFDLIN